MKARENDRRILERDDLKLNVLVICESNESDVKNIEKFRTSFSGLELGNEAKGCQIKQDKGGPHM